jgi:pyruvate dehydrogenase E2 component (dihydrolipoamide acetyltransferase)
MTLHFKLPELGEHVEAADLIKILVSVGDRIELDQPVLELETDKADFELPSTISGIVKEIHVREGGKVKVGQLILTVDEAASGPGLLPTKSGAPPAPEEEAAPAVVREGIRPQLPVEKPVPRPVSPPEPTGGAGKSQSPATEPQETGSVRPPVPATPTVRRLARELGISIEQVTGSGPAGRILSEDIKAFAKQAIRRAGEAAVPVRIPAPPLPDFSRWGEVERKDMTAMRRKIAASMSHSWSDIPHVTHYESADITELEQLRKDFSGEIEAAGGKLTVTSIVVKTVASALKVYPNFAASLDMEREQIILKKYCHIGVAVDTDRGLIVPVIRDADKKNILELSVELARLAEKARSKKITLEELGGAVFTITNLGGIGGTQFSPIIHAPEVAILGISRARHEAIWMDGKFAPRLMLPLALSYDHRFIDGADAARFLRWIAEALEQPFRLPLHG